MYENNPNVYKMVAALSSGDNVAIDGETYSVGGISVVCGPYLMKGKRGYQLHFTADGLRIRSNGGRGRSLDKVVSSFEHVPQTACDAACPYGGTGPDCVPDTPLPVGFSTQGA
jgi:hypothetical protein